jgi:hypothetical protein
VECVIGIEFRIRSQLGSGAAATGFIGAQGGGHQECHRDVGDSREHQERQHLH